MYNTSLSYGPSIASSYKFEYNESAKLARFTVNVKSASVQPTNNNEVAWFGNILAPAIAGSSKQVGTSYTYAKLTISQGASIMSFKVYTNTGDNYYFDAFSFTYTYAYTS